MKQVKSTLQNEVRVYNDIKFMKAVQYNSYGGVEVLEINENAPTPTLKESQILVEVKAASINPFDFHVREGAMKDKIPLQFPVTIGGDFGGLVKEVPEGVSGFKVSDEVYGSGVVVNGGSGAFAEMVAVNSRNLALKPKNISLKDSSALPLVGSSAIQALEEHIKLQSGQKVLIHGGAGGIGSTAIQIAKALGAYVATTAAAKDIEFVKGLGADEVIDYTSQKFEEELHDFDAVYDTVGGETTNNSFKVLKKGGILVSMVGKPSEELAAQYEVTVIGQSTHTTTEHLNSLAKLVDEGKVIPQIDKEFPLDQVKEAFTYQEKTHPRGKVVIIIS